MIIDIVNVGFALFCSKCNLELRAATPADHQGDFQQCPRCHDKTKCIVGLRITASSEDARMKAKRELEVNPDVEDVLYDVLSFFLPE